jgi:DNA-binding MarR family transcriptional regulator
MNLAPTRLTEILRDTILGLVRREEPDLTARQLAVLLVCYLDEGPHTVRGLAERLDVGRPAISHALARLEQFDLASRQHDPRDRRSVVVAQTTAGHTFVRKLHEILVVSAGSTVEP